MKKKIFLALAISALLVCLFAVGVSASSDFSTVTTSDTIDLSGMSTDTTSRVVLATVDENGEVTAYTTYPSQYIVKSGSTLYYDFSKINTAFETSYDKDSVVRFEVPTTITSIPDKTTVLRGVKRLAYIEFKSSSISFEGNALRQCKALVEVVLPTNATFNNGYVFTDCTSLTTVKCEGGLKSIKGNQFYGCSKLTNVELSNEITEYPKECFYGCSSLTQEIDLTNVTIIRSKAFQNCKAIFVNANNLSCVEQDGFRNASGMTSVEFASDLSLIGNYAFNGTKLTSAKFNGGNFTIGSQAFNSVSTLVGEIDLTGCTSIGSTAFKATSITGVKIPAGFTSIGDYAFQNCSKITSLEFLGDAAPNAVIGTAAFENCYTIGNVFIPEGVTTINNCAFSAAGVTNLSLPSTLTTVNGNSTFNVWGKGSVIKSEYMLKSVTGLENTKITTIVSSMFRGQSQWKPETIILPNTVETIQDSYAFADVGMTNIYLGANLKTLGNEAFTACANLKNVYIPGTITTFGNNPFYGKGVNFFVTSEDTDYLAALAAKAGVAAENYVSAADYEANPDNYKNGKYIIYGYNPCKAFYNDVHNIVSEEGNTCSGICQMCGSMKLLANPIHAEEIVLAFGTGVYVDEVEEKTTDVNYYANMYVLHVCKNCENETADAEEYAPIFVKIGYSAEEEDTTSISFFTSINYASLLKYEEIADTKLQYGLIVSAAASSTPIKSVVDGAIELNASTVKVSMTDTEYAKFSVRISKLPANQTLNCCGYVIENDKVTYLGHESTSAEAEIIDHAGVIELTK